MEVCFGNLIGCSPKTGNEGVAAAAAVVVVVVVVVVVAVGAVCIPQCFAAGCVSGKRLEFVRSE